MEKLNSKNGFYYGLIQKLKKLDEEVNNIFLFNSLETMCESSKCNYKVGNKLLYRDDDHISDYAAKHIISPALIKFLNEKQILN